MEKKDAIKKLDMLFSALIARHELIDEKCREIERKVRAYRKRNRQRMKVAKIRWKQIRKRLLAEDDSHFYKIEETKY